MAKVALLIGVSEYEPGLNPLAGAVKDVDAMQRVLQHPDMGGFASADITVLKNPQRQAMEEAIEALFFNRQKDDLVLVYFSGHGIKDDIGRLYLATRQTRKNTKGELVRTTAVAASLIHDVMENSRSRRQVIILDCCFSGAFASGMKAKDDGSLDIKNQLAETKKPQSVEGRVVLTSSTAIQYSFEQEGSELSVYTRYLVEGIEKGAADTDNDGVISVDELHEYARKKVQEAAPAMKPEIYVIKEGYKIQLAKATVADPKVKYRKEVQRYAIRGEISPVGRMILNNLYRQLGLSGPEAEKIEVEVLRGYNERLENLHKYRDALLAAVKYEYPLSEQTRYELKAFQQMLSLRDTDIQPIEQELTTQFVHEETPTSVSEPSYREQIPAQLEQEVDLTLEIALTKAEMLNGIVKQITTTENEVINVTIPAGISPGKKLRVKGKGKLNLLTQQRGNLYLLVNQITAQADNLNSEKGVNYTKLRDLLAAGKWKEADDETYLVMLQAVGREKNDYITEEELSNFPCTDLLTIDQLWVKYSNGRFGFSVQKKIYLSVAGNLNGSYDDEACNKFGARVGWRVLGNWITYGKLTFDNSTPEGHLPFPYRFVVSSTRAWLCVFAGGLFSRIETCQLHTTKDDLSSEKGVDYTKLRDLLAAGKWKEADNKTYQVMLQVVGREENDYIRSSELSNFPCTDLRTINQLWVKYSNGRFGFSVQKEIYLSVGGKPDGKYYEQAWEKFGDRVGWRVKENWISYCTFDITAPEGHLPFLWTRCMSGRAIGWQGRSEGGAEWFGLDKLFSSLESTFGEQAATGNRLVLFSRFETCKL